MIASTATIWMPLMIQATAPHWANLLRASTSLVTRAVSAPFRAAVCSARLSRCRWANVRTRSP
jgi:hypothetical protein